MSQVRIHQTARKHGISDDAMMHALRFALAEVIQTGDLLMVIGPDHTGRLLEVGVLDADDDDPVIIHAMVMSKERTIPVKG